MMNEDSAQHLHTHCNLLHSMRDYTLAVGVRKNYLVQLYVTGCRVL